jgi:hypothetical protein
VNPENNMNLKLLVVLASLVVLGSVACDIYLCHDAYTVFQRSGSLLIIFGAVFESKYILRLGENNTLYVDGELTVHESKYTPIPKVKFFSKDAATRHLGFYVVLAGTLVSGYGDLLGKVFT